ncbi:unnamed protein product [Gordionus sp. m RMFG-2023]
METCYIKTKNDMIMEMNLVKTNSDMGMIWNDKWKLQQSAAMVNRMGENKRKDIIQDSKRIVSRRRSRPIECYGCGGVGHISRHCPTLTTFSYRERREARSRLARRDHIPFILWTTSHTIGRKEMRRCVSAEEDVRDNTNMTRRKEVVIKPRPVQSVLATANDVCVGPSTTGDMNNREIMGEQQGEEFTVDDLEELLLQQE